MKAEMENKKSTVAVIQARMASTRLPGKVMMDLAGKPMLERVIERVRQAKKVDQVIVAVPDNAPDCEPIWNLCRDMGVQWNTGGAEEDVLTRYQVAAEATGAETIVRITSDCPLIDPDVIDRVISAFEGTGADYASNTIVRTWPRGMDVEVFSRALLEKTAAAVTDRAAREHVTTAMLASPDCRKAPVVLGGTSAPNYSAMNWSVDTQEDLDRVRAIYRVLGTVPDFNWRNALAIEKALPQTILPTITAGRAMPRKVAIIGTAPSTCDLAPFDDPSWEIWSLTNRVVTDQVKRWDRHFELHPLSQFENDPQARPYVDWMHRQPADRPIYLQAAGDYPGIVAGVQFPYDPVIGMFGRYFTSSIAWQVAFAIYEGVDEIGLWGVDLLNDEEYAHQRPCVEFLLGYAVARHIGLTIPRLSSLLKPQMLYGFNSDDPGREAIAAHKERMAKLAQQYQVERDTAALHLAHVEGAIKGLLYAERVTG